MTRHRFRQIAIGIWRSALADQAGSAMVQFALILPPFLMMMFGVIEVGRVMWLQNALHYAIEQAARCAAVTSTTCADDATTTAYVNGISGANFPSLVLHLTTPSCGKQVIATASARLYIPYYNNTWTLNAQACFPA